MRLRSNKGNAFTIVIVALALFTVFVGTIFMQLNNQIKSNKNTLESISSKYAAEAGIEKASTKVIDQIEFKVNSSNMMKRNYTNSIKAKDEFADVKNELKKAYDGLLELNNKYTIFNDSTAKLYSIIINEYTTVDTFKNDINQVKLDIIQILALANDEIKSHVKSTVYSILELINSSQLILYSSNKVHEGSDHGALDIKIDLSNSHDIKVDYDYIQNNFIGSYDEEYSYKLKTISEYTTKVLRQNLKLLKENIKVYEPWTLQNKLTTIDNKCINNIENELITLNNTFIEMTNLRNDNCTDEKINEIKKKMYNQIDNIIKNGIEAVEIDIYKLYIEDFTYHKELTSENYEYIKNIFMNLEVLKNNLVELKCKLGLRYSDTSGDITLPDEDTSIITELYIELDSFEDILDTNYSYTVQKINRTPINVIYTSNRISRVENLELEIVSTGNVQGKKYKRKATVLFTTTKEGDKFITNYTIKSYDKN